MDDNKFWVYVNGMIAVLLIVVCVSTYAYWTDHNEKIVKMIESGVSPVAAMCALQDDFGNHPVCLVLATKMQEVK